MSGAAFGLVYSLASAIGAGAEVPQRTYGAAGTIALLLGVLINPMLGYGMQTYSVAGVFSGIVILAVVLASTGLNSPSTRFFGYHCGNANIHWFDASHGDWPHRFYRRR